MSWTTPQTVVTGNVLPETFLDALRDNLAYLKVNVALESAVALTIASGVVTKSCAHHKIETESAASTDDLDTISGGVEGEIILIRPGSNTVVIKNGTGNISCSSDITLSALSHYVLLIHNGSVWCAISGSGGIQGPQGEKGDTGAQGPQGEKGDKGDAGSGVAGETLGFLSLLLPDGYLPYFDIDDGIVRVLPNPNNKNVGFPLLQGFTMKNGLLAVH